MQILGPGRTCYHSCQVINRPHTDFALYLGPACNATPREKGTGQTGGPFFARIAPSSQKAAPLICLRPGGSGGFP